jgi:hypothetical protein
MNLTIPALVAVLLSTQEAAVVTPSDTAPKPPVTQMVLALTTGEHVAASWPLTTDQRNRTSDAWVWSDDAPPQHFESAAIPKDDSSLQRALHAHPTRALSIHVRGGSSREDLANVEVIVAPEQMWATVPEPLLPRFRVSPTGDLTASVNQPVIVRARGKGMGTSWQRLDTTGATTLQLRKASDIHLRTRRHDGAPAGGAHVVVMQASLGTAVLDDRTRFVAGPKGELTLPSFPDADVITLVFHADGAAPLSLNGVPSDLEGIVTLPEARLVRGRFVDEKGSPLPDVEVRAEAWIGNDVSAMSRASARSNQNGAWQIEGLPAASAALRASAKARVPFTRTARLEKSDLDLGTITLAAAVAARVHVRADDGSAIAKATITADTGFRGLTDKDGIVDVTGLSATEATALVVKAEGFDEQTLPMTPPFTKQEEVVLERAFTVSGRVVDAQDQGGRATILLQQGTSERRLTTDDDGTFLVAPKRDATFVLVFETPDRGSTTLQQDAGTAGEKRDLGNIHLQPGASVVGTVVDRSGNPVAGAAIWTVRDSAAGTVAAWVAGRVARATTDDLGRFELRGMPEGPALLRFDAREFARAYREVRLEGPTTDTGEVELSRGGTVIVEGRDEGIARIDLRGTWVDADMMTADLRAGVARLRNVPSGKYRVTVLSGRAISCDRTAEVEDGKETVVTCPPPMHLRGKVLLDGTPAPGGSLQWMQASGTDALINTHVSPMGAQQQRVYGQGPGEVRVPVRPEGTFESDALRPGEWQVTWRASDSTATPSRPLVIPDGKDATVLIEFSGGVIRGEVVDEAGAPVTGARVRERNGSLFALAASDGTFTMTGVSGGTHQLEASLGAKSSKAIRVEVRTGQPTPPVTLVVGTRTDNLLSLTIVDETGQPRPGAIVFVDLPTRIRTLTADAAGTATLSVPDGIADGTRVVAFSANQWTSTRLKGVSADEVPGPATVRFGETGSLQISSRETSGTVQVASDSAGDLTWMLQRVGYVLNVTPATPLVLSGLPVGRYSVAGAGVTQTVAIGRDDAAKVSLP